MKTTLADIIPKMFRYSEKLDNNTSLMKSAWIMVDENKSFTIKYIFRPEKILLISENGKEKKGKWEYLGDSSILIEKEDENFLFNHAFLDEKLLVLKLDSDSKFFVMVNEKLIDQDIDSHEKVISYIQSNYDLNMNKGQLTATKIANQNMIQKLPLKTHIHKIKLLTGDILEVHYEPSKYYYNKFVTGKFKNNELIGKNATICGRIPIDGFYKADSSSVGGGVDISHRKISIKNGIIQNILFFERFTGENSLEVEKNSGRLLGKIKSELKGKSVYIDDNNAPNGDYC